MDGPLTQTGYITGGANIVGVSSSSLGPVTQMYGGSYTAGGMTTGGVYTSGGYAYKTGGMTGNATDEGEALYQSAS